MAVHVVMLLFLLPNEMGALTACSLPFSAFPDDYSKDLYKAHAEELYKGLLIHLDDASSEIQVSEMVLIMCCTCMSFCIL